jgi:hypothetical protein
MTPVPQQTNSSFALYARSGAGSLPGLMPLVVAGRAQPVYPTCVHRRNTTHGG